MRKTNRKYEVRPLGCDWALDIPLGDTTVVLYFNSRNNAELVKDVLEWEDNHPNEAAPYQPTLTPPNEPLTLDELREMDGEPVYDYLGQEWYVIQEYYDHELTMTDGTRFFDDDEIDGVDKRFYRRPPEGEV